MTNKLKIDRKFMPLLATVGVFALLYLYGFLQYKGMRQPQAFFNLFINNAFLLITSIGMTFVILSEGIDLSVGAVIALTSVASAALLENYGMNPVLVIVLMLLMGTLFGGIMGAIIHFFKVQPFIVTLAGMFFARGMCFFISLDAIPIKDPLYRTMALTRIQIPGFERAFLSLSAVIAIVVLIVGMYVAHFTRYGRSIYAIGGNEQSALLMGLPVGRIKVSVYALNGFCSALAGIVFSISLLSGHGLYAVNVELDAIASVVIGGTLLTGGQGYVFGTLFGVLVTGLIQMLIQFNGELSSWWTRIAVGALTLIFIGVQSLFTSRRKKRQALGRASLKDVEAKTAVPMEDKLTTGSA
ncbi:MAG: sugar ABC transporter permease YjfF [Anaerolineales bacterium]|nr:sugar ABC transporter permease YjfF [Anaerolineales bacterium]